MTANEALKSDCDGLGMDGFISGSDYRYIGFASGYRNVDPIDHRKRRAM